MKRKLYLFIPLLLGSFLIINFGKITDSVAYLLRHEPTVIISTPNSYYKESNYKFVQISDDFIPYSKQDVRNIFYTILNSGYDVFTFYCPTQYVDCLEDVNQLSSDDTMLTHINNFTSPFNNFNNLKVTYDESGEVTVEVHRAYSKNQVDIINDKIDDIFNTILDDEMILDDKILALHDYVINNTKYDHKRLDGDTTHASNIAYGPLIEGLAICGGYADSMALFLNRLDVPNFKVASKTHVWNAVYLNDKWLHLDLTWDDPVSDDNEDHLIHKFYLINSDTLDKYNISDHSYDKSIYQEFKKSE